MSNDQPKGRNNIVQHGFCVVSFQESSRSTFSRHYMSARLQMDVGMSVLTLESQIILWLGGVRWCVFCLDDVHITLEHELV